MTGPLVSPPAAVFAGLALLVSLPFTATPSGSAPGRLLLFALSLAIFWRLASSPVRLPVRMAMAAVLALGPCVMELLRGTWRHLSIDNGLAALFGAHGLLYGAPLLWAGFLGLISLRGENPALVRLALAAIVPGTLGLLVLTDRTEVYDRTITWVPFLLPGLAQFFEKTRAFAARRPERVLACSGGLLVLWNLLFMEQYRRRLLPSDDTVSFAQVTSNSAGLLSRAIGSPFAWPANWIFAWRFQTSLDRWDAIADRRLFTDRTAVATIEFGDDASLFAPDMPLLLEGFGQRRTCERGWCRDLDGAGRLLLPLQDVGRGLVIRLRSRGTGALRVSLNGSSTSVSELTESLRDVTLRVPAPSVVSGINVLALSVSGGGKAAVDRLTLERDLASGSARSPQG